MTTKDISEVLMNVYYCNECEHLAVRTYKDFNRITYHLSAINTNNPMSITEVCLHCGSPDIKKIGLTWEQFYQEILEGTSYNEREVGVWFMSKEEFQQRLFEVLL